MPHPSFLDKAMATFGDKVLKRAKGEGLRQSSADLITTIVETDPTGKYASWLIQRYADGGINRFEDMSRAKPLLARYDLLKSRKKIPEGQRDINRVKTLGDLQDIVEEHAETPLVSRRESRKDEEQAFYNAGHAILLHDDDEVKIVIPKTKRASCFFGRNTRWCTAATETNNFFRNYRKSLYVILIKKKNKRYQIYFSQYACQFMDERDERINPRVLAKDYPILWEIFRQPSLAVKSVSMVLDPTDEEQMIAVKHDPKEIQYIINPTDAIKLVSVKYQGIGLKYIDNPSEALQLLGVENNYAAIQFLNNPSEAVQLAAVQRNGSAIKFIRKPSLAVKMAAVQNNGHAINHIKRASVDIKMAAIRSNPNVLQYGIRRPTEAMKLSAVEISGFVIRYIKKPSEAVQLAAIKQNSLAIFQISNPCEAAKRAAGVDTFSRISRQVSP